MITKKLKYFVFLLLAVVLSGCWGTKHLQGNEKMLARQRVQAPKNINAEKLRELYIQRPNRRFLSILPVHHLVVVYYWGAKHYNQERYIEKKEMFEQKFDAKIARAGTQKRINNLSFRKQKKMDKFQKYIDEGNLRMRWGEPIAVFDSSKVATTETRFREYLFSEGYFQNRVTSEVKTHPIKKKFVSVAYKVNPGQPYLIDSIFYQISDTAVLRTVRQNEDKSLIRKGDRYSEDKLSAERERLDLLMKDNGFYDFSRQYVDYSIDSTMLGNRRLIAMLTISDPAKRTYHKRFRIDSIRFTTDATVSIPNAKRMGRFYKDIRYAYYKDNYNLKILTQRVFISPGELYSRSETQKSQLRLANLDAFKFVNINYDTTGGKFIANIFTSPLDRYEWTNEVGVNVTQGYPGPFYNLNLKKRNIFKGLENLELNGRIGIEGVASATKELNVYKSTEAGVNMSLIFPQFIWPLREQVEFRVAEFNPKTRFSVGYNYTDRPEYRRSATTISQAYTWQNQRSTQYSLGLVNVSVINSKLDPEFSDVLDSLRQKGYYNLARSFLPSFVSSMIFTMTWNKNYGLADKNSMFIRTTAETGGTTLNFINPDIISNQGLQYFKYIRFGFDFRRTRILNRFVTMAYRFNTGLAWAYGDDNSLPYEKYFFVGGSNSVRAWRPRRLGPGSVPPLEATDKRADGYFDYGLEKPGEILFEGSLELRSKIIGFVDGAVFLDAGNVWSFSQLNNQQTDTPVQGNAQFKMNSFYKEIGVGTGFGLRFDFSFLILRLDVGIKVYDPARIDGERFVLDRMKFFNPFATQNADGTFSNFREPVIYNLGIGYPF